MTEDRPEFVCDAMLGGLARWLRAAGYDAEFVYGIDDRDLIERARATGATLLSSDGPMFERNVIKNGTVKALFIPRDLTVSAQLAFVMTVLRLAVRQMPRCMACGGALIEVEKESIRAEAPPKSFAACAQFWRCDRCGKLLWQGAHWRRISARLAEMRTPAL